MNLNVEKINNNLVFKTNKGDSFELNSKELSKENMEKFINFISIKEDEYLNSIRYKLVIEQECIPDNPRYWDNVGTMIGWHRRYQAGDKHDYSEPIDLIKELAYNSDYEKAECLEEKYNLNEIEFSEYFEKLMKIAKNNHLILPVYLLDHSIVKYSVNSFNDPWDSGKVGFIYVSHDAIKKEFGDISDETLNIAKKQLEGEVETYSHWANGEVYGFKLLKIDEDDNEIEEIDSCYGFYGNNIKENGILDELSEEFRYLVDSDYSVYSYMN